jgi:hypothetical protein
MAPFQFHLHQCTIVGSHFKQQIIKHGKQIARRLQNSQEIHWKALYATLVPHEAAHNWVHVTIAPPQVTATQLVWHLILKAILHAACCSPNSSPS